MSNELRIPEILLQQRGFCLKIAENNGKLFEYVEYLKRLVTGMHAIYQQLCKRMIKAAEDCERRMVGGKSNSQHAMVMLGLVRSISLLHLTISNQLSNNGVALGTKSHKVARNRLEILRQKLEGCDRLNREYLQMVETFNKKEKSLREKCEYFQDYEKDVLKYYSLKANCDLYDRLAAKQLRLRQRLEAIIRSKDQYKINISEIRLTIKQYYEMELAMLSDYKRLLLNIRRANAQRQLYNQPIIEELSQDAASTHQDNPHDTHHDITSKRSERGRSVVHTRREIIKEYQRTVEVEELLQQLLRVLHQEVETAGRGIDELRSDKQYQHFAAQRLIMTEILPAESLRDVDLILGEISFFRSIIIRLGNVFGKTKVLEELKKYRGFNFDRFVEDTNPLAEKERRQGESSELRTEFMVLQLRFQAAHSEYNARYQERIIQLEQLILSHYYLEEQVLQEKGRRAPPKGDLFQKKYYEILMIPFFLSKHESFAFQENPHLKKFSDHINANRIQKMMTLTGFFRNKEPRRLKATCCGLLRSEPAEQGPKLVDEFHCALKDGLILVQGKLKLFENYLNFSSSFNSKTIFGYSDIRIPKWDINAFSEDRHLLSAMVVVQTTHGALHFTSFLTNPFTLLNQTYSDRRSGMSIAVPPRAGESELQLLQGRFQGQLRGELKRRGILIDKLSTYLSEGRESLSICLQYHTAITPDTALFEIKINYSEVSLQYMFIHDDAQKSQKVREELQTVAKELINRRADQPAPNDRPAKDASIIDLEYSIIEPNQRNKISFLREPSFINRRSETEDFLRNSQAECGQLLTSRNFLNQETSKNIDLLQQRILSEEDDRNTPSNIAFCQQDPQEHTTSHSPRQQILSPIACLNEEKDQRSRLVTPSHSRTVSKSTRTSKPSTQAFDYKTILLLLGILLGVNLILNTLY